jgi:hypothetical protein
MPMATHFEAEFVEYAIALGIAELAHETKSSTPQTTAEYGSDDDIQQFVTPGPSHRRSFKLQSHTP